MYCIIKIEKERNQATLHKEIVELASERIGVIILNKIARNFTISTAEWKWVNAVQRAHASWRLVSVGHGPISKRFNCENTTERTGNRGLALSLFLSLQFEAGQLTHFLIIPSSFYLHSLSRIRLDIFAFQYLQLRY